MVRFVLSISPLPVNNHSILRLEYVSTIEFILSKPILLLIALT
nr:MAG TPA: hypothetical protein [Caudoviricetes sp.]